MGWKFSECLRHILTWQPIMTEQYAVFHFSCIYISVCAYIGWHKIHQTGLLNDSFIIHQYSDLSHLWYGDLNTLYTRILYIHNQYILGHVTISVPP